MGREDIMYIYLSLVKVSFTGPRLTIVKCNKSSTMYLAGAEVEIVILGEEYYLPQQSMYIQE